AFTPRHHLVDDTNDGLESPLRAQHGVSVLAAAADEAPDARQDGHLPDVGLAEVWRPAAQGPKPLGAALLEIPQLVLEEEKVLKFLQSPLGFRLLDSFYPFPFGLWAVCPAS